MTERVTQGKDPAESTVLIVDDDPSLARAASRLLRSMGFKVLIAHGGREAIEICRVRVNEIDVVLLDLVLSEMSSLETLQQLRSMSPGIKVILTSGYGKQESAARFAEMQPDGYLPKPFGYFELESAIRVALARVSRAADK